MLGVVVGMRVAIGVAPYKSKKGTALLTQNRQFQWSKSGTVIYPVVLASCATMLKEAGHEVNWMDGVAEDASWDDYLFALTVWEPDYLLWEVKTPVIKQTWKFLEALNEQLPGIQVVLCGDHVTALPQETQEKFPGVIILIGGDYDKRMCEYLHGETPMHTPLIDRELTSWRLYDSKNGNFKTVPGAYTMFARDCWHRKEGGCTFCSWTNLYKDFNVCTPSEAMEEVKNLASLGVKEIFDDSGTFPVGEWLTEFCTLLKEFNGDESRRVRMGINMRSGVLNLKDWEMLSEAGIKYVLLGCESANDSTLERLNKGYTVKDVVESCENATKVGVDTHLTFMFGYPKEYETKEDSYRTVKLAKNLFKRGVIKSVQGTTCVPYPGTALFNECVKNGWLLTNDWDDWDMSQPVIESDFTPEELKNIVADLYKSCLTPTFIWRSILDSRPLELLRKAKYLWRYIK